MSSWQPESTRCTGASLDTSYSYLSPMPAAVVKDPAVECILGVDEAGRGPVLGPMVYGVSYCTIDYADSISKHGFMDSKVLDHETRVRLLQQISDVEHELYAQVGWSVRVMSARDIGAGMLRPMAPYNLNAQAHDTTIQLIRDVLNQGVNVRKIFVDTVGIAETYQAKLQREFPMAEVTVSKKADSIYPIVSVASICAKVTRDKALELAAAADDPLSEADEDKENVEVLAPAEPAPVAVKRHIKATKKRKNEFDSDVSDSEDSPSALQKEQSFVDERAIGSWGSGYPSDARTQNWLKANVNAIFGWRGPIRYSWSTVKDILEGTGRSVTQKGAIKVNWFEDENTEAGQQTLDFSGQRGAKKEGYTVQNWFGQSVGVNGFKV